MKKILLATAALAFVVGFCSAPFHASATRPHCPDTYQEATCASTSTTTSSTTTSSTSTTLAPTTTASTTTSSSSTSTSTTSSSVEPTTTTTLLVASSSSSTPPASASSVVTVTDPCRPGELTADGRIVDARCNVIACHVNATNEMTFDYRIVNGGTGGSTMGPGPLPCEPLERLTDTPPSPSRTLPSTGIAPELGVIAVLLMVAGTLLVMTSRRSSR